MWLTRFFCASSFGLDKFEKEFLDRKVVKVRIEGSVVLLYVNKCRILALWLRNKRGRKERRRERGEEKEVCVGGGGEGRESNQSLRPFTCHAIRLL